eukprot:3937190-Rhodomonas_salina.1
MYGREGVLDELTDGAESWLILDESRRMNGFWMHVPEGEEGPGKFLLEGTADNVTWTACGASVWKFGVWGEVQLLEKERFRAWFGGDAPLELDIRVSLLHSRVRACTLMAHMHTHACTMRVHTCTRVHVRT